MKASLRELIRLTKLAELRKLCKKHDLLTTGTKLELISRLIDNQGENFTILQPGDEAKLLGDDVDEESIPFNITDAAALDKLDNDADLINIRTTSDPKSSQPSGQPTVIGSKRTVSRLSESSACPVPEKSKAVESTQSNSDISTAKTVISLAPSDQSSAMSETDCLNARAIRFGLQRPAGAGAALTDDKLAARARRFGLPVNENRSTSTTGGIRAVTGPSVDAELLRKRAERFGEVTSPIVDKLAVRTKEAMSLTVFLDMFVHARRWVEQLFPQPTSSAFSSWMSAETVAQYGQTMPFGSRPLIRSDRKKPVRLGFEDVSQKVSMWLLPALAATGNANRSD
ncbi:SAP domain-containing ribonucleoprotein [Clonorchis sinensis]|uniref:SAP domain-containing ribonucleoprotein n=1 Tax=Clonorchis sinensis TaxID=79923 RepID=G7Y8B0_CLOSI|nr:SAP domain-containing ribonucleoprotein [Clonorchis sinensis]